MKTVLFICTHNSARSQLAQGLVNHFWADTWQAQSAGTEKTVVKPEAITALAKLGIDISHHTSKTVDELTNKNFDLVVTVCDSAKETCPWFPGKMLIHKSFEDPSLVTEPPLARQQAFDDCAQEILAWLKATLPTININK